MSLFEPHKLYDTQFLAAHTGLSVSSIRKVTAGFRLSPLIPRVTRLGPMTVRFLGSDILAWLNDPQGQSEQTRPLQAATTTGQPAPNPARRRGPGRPSNRERDAGLRAGGAV